MAYRKKTISRSRSRTASRTSYGVRSGSRSRKATGSRSRTTPSQTLRIVIEQPTASGYADTGVAGAPRAARKSMF